MGVVGFQPDGADADLDTVAVVDACQLVLLPAAADEPEVVVPEIAIVTPGQGVVLRRQLALRGIDDREVRG